MRRLVLMVSLGILTLAVSAIGHEYAPPRQEAPAMIEQLIPDHVIQVVDSVAPLTQPDKSVESVCAVEPVEAPAESTQSAVSKEEKEPGLTEKARKGAAALRIMGRVGSGLLRNFMEDLIGDA